MGQFVHVTVFRLKPPATRDLVKRIRSTMEAIEAAQTPPLRAGTILVSDDESRVALVSEWDDRAAWAQAQWDERVQDSVVDLFRSAEQVESQSYNEVFRLARPRRS